MSYLYGTSSSNVAIYVFDVADECSDTSLSVSKVRALGVPSEMIDC